MTKSQAAKILLCSTLLALLLNVLFGRWLSVKLSTWPLLNRWKILSPQAPIVINTREEVRVSDTGDILQAIDVAKSKLSAVLIKNAGQISYGGGAVNLTSDGLFLTTKSVIGNSKAENILLRLYDGTSLSVQAITDDPATDLVILKTAGTNVPTANLGSAKNLQPGSKVIFLANSLQDASPFFESNFITAAQANDYAAIKDADAPSRAFQVQARDEQINGAAVVNLNGEVVGLWDASSVLSSDVMQDLIGDYFNGNGQLSRPMFGFKYRPVSPAEAAALSLPIGAKVSQVSAGGPAQKAGLEANDLIIAVGSASLGKDAGLEELLQKFQPGDSVALTVLRGKNQTTLILTPGVLK